MYNFNEKIKNIIIFHHNDMDGYVGAAAIFNAVKEYASYMALPRFVECSYSNNKKWKDIIHNEELKDTMVCIVDFSFPIEELLYLGSKIGRENVVWIDHHVGIINKYIDKLGTELSTFPGLRISTGLCGAELAYLYFNYCIAQPISSKNILVICNNEYHTDSKKDRDLLIKEFIPRGVKLVGDWDVFRHVETPENRDAIALKYNFEVADNDLYVLDNYRMYLYEILARNELDCAIATGKIIDKYEIACAKKNVKSNSFPCTIVGYENIEAVALNQSGRFSSMVFDEIRDKYEIGVLYCFNGKKSIYSFYRLGKNPERIINCYEIAMHFGGGGHMSAAGATVDRATEVIRVNTGNKKPAPKPSSYLALEVENIDQLLQCDVMPGDCVFVKDASGDSRTIYIDEDPWDGQVTGAVYVRRHGPKDNYKTLEGWELCGVITANDDTFTQ